MMLAHVVVFVLAAWVATVAIGLVGWLGWHVARAVLGVGEKPRWL